MQFLRGGAYLNLNATYDLHRRFFVPLFESGSTANSLESISGSLEMFHLLLPTGMHDDYSTQRAREKLFTVW
jgi:hypothetical protein